MSLYLLSLLYSYNVCVGATLQTPNLLSSLSNFYFGDHLLLLFKFLAGASETVVLNMSTLIWSVVTTIPGRVPLASEVF